VFNQGNTPALEEVSDDIRVLRTDIEGRLWVGAREGIAKFHRGIWEKGLKVGLKDRARVRDLCVASNSRTWVATDRGIRKVVGESLLTEDLPPMLAKPQYGTTAVLESSDGYLWVTAPEGLLRWHPNRPDPVVIVTKWEVGVSRAGSLVQGRDGTVWAGSPGALRKLTGLNLTSYSLPSGDYSGDNFRPQRLCLDAQDTPWVAIDPQGILCQLREGRLTLVSGEDGEAISKVQAVLSDREGNLWCGTSGNGLLRLRREPIGALHLSSSADFLSAVSVMEGPHGEIWMGTENGAVTWWRDGAFAFEFKAPLSWESKTYTLGVDPGGGEVWASFATRGVMEVGVAAKSSWIEPNTRAPGWLADRGAIRALRWTSSETAWLGTESGLYRMRRSGDRTRFPPQESPRRLDIRTLHEGKDGSLWLGLMNGGLARIPDAEHATDEVEILSWTQNDGLPGASVWCLYEDAGSDMWDGFGPPGGRYWQHRSVYGNPQLLPLMGGSGAATGFGFTGGGGGGAVLIASEGRITLGSAGVISAKGGGNNSADAAGGAIRLVANELIGSGTINAGPEGIIRLESNISTQQRFNKTPDTQAYLPGNPAQIWPAADAPTARIVQVNGLNVPADPLARIDDGSDIRMETATPVDVIIETRNFPVSGKVMLRVGPKFGAATEVAAEHDSGNQSLSKWKVSRVLATGFTVLQVRAFVPRG